MPTVCPNANLQEWKDLVAAVGEEKAHLIFFRENGEHGTPDGFTIPTAARAKAMLTNASEAVKAIYGEVKGIPKFTPFKQTVNAWVGENQATSLKVRKYREQLEKQVPEKLKREGITNWLQAGGDKAQLEQWAKDSTNPEYRRGYIAALALSPKDIAVAKEIEGKYNDLLAEAQKYGIVRNGLDNYVNQAWKRPMVGGGSAADFAGKLRSTFRFGKQRKILGGYFEGEQAGMQPVTKDIADLVSVYQSEMGKVIATRKLVEGLTGHTAADGRPLAAPTGSAKLVTNAESGDPEVTLTFPDTHGKDTGDYKSTGSSALAEWKWAGTDTDGKPVLMRGSLALHPEIYQHVKNMLGRSAIREWYDTPSGPLKSAIKRGVKAIDLGQGAVKQMMLSLSPFHYVQEGTHAIGHRINPFWKLPELNPTDPHQVAAMDHGLMLAGDHVAIEQFSEGLMSGPLMYKLPVIGNAIRAASEHLFNEYIPQLKLKTYSAMLERNTKLYASELAAGKVKADDMMYLSAHQANAAYGHLNYADMGRNPTMQHLLRSVALAPDFLEARGRFAGQAVKGAVSKSGREQLHAVALLATVFYGASRIINKTMDDDYHFDEPFGVIIKGRRYTMRSVPEDVWRMFKDTRRFAYGRLSPIIGQGAIQIATGTNFRGEKVSFSDTLADMATRWIPISLRNAPGVKQLSETSKYSPVSGWENLLSSMGLQISRVSPINEIYDMARTFKKAQGIKEDTGTYPVSQYQQLRYGLEDDNAGKVEDELKKLGASGFTVDKLTKGFHESLFSPFTKTKALDQKFAASLSPEDRAKYDNAVAWRQTVYRRFLQHLRENAGEINAAARGKKAPDVPPVTEMDTAAAPPTRKLSWDQFQQAGIPDAPAPDDENADETLDSEQQRLTAEAEEA